MNNQNFNYYPEATSLNYLQHRQEINQNAIPQVPEIYIETEIFLNRGKYGEFHMSFPDSEKERDMVFTGTIYETGKDHIILYNQNTNEWYMLPLLYLNYTIFREKPNTYNSINM